MIRTSYNVNQYKKNPKIKKQQQQENVKTKLWEEILIYIIVKSKIV